MASTFSVCALVENWRVIVPHGPGGNEAHGIDIKDPGWYVTGNIHLPEQQQIPCMSSLGSN